MYQTGWLLDDHSVFHFLAIVPIDSPAFCNHFHFMPSNSLKGKHLYVMQEYPD